MADTQNDILSNKLPSVSEPVLKKRRKRAASKLKELKALKRAKPVFKRKHFKRAEQFVKEHRQKTLDHNRIVRESKLRGNFLREPDHKLAFVIRVRGNVNSTDEVKNILKLLRLSHQNQGTLIKMNKLTLNMLRVVQPFVTWGIPDLKSVRELIYKRGRSRYGKKFITSNEMIEEHLGSEGFICIEDIIKEIVTVGDKFQKVMRFLDTFKLKKPVGNWIPEYTHFKDGGNYGNRKEKINELIMKMI